MPWWNDDLSQFVAADDLFCCTGAAVCLCPRK